MFHNMKKTLNVHKSKERTTDQEFNALYAVFKTILVQSEGIATAIKGNAAVWDNIGKNFNMTLDAVCTALNDPKDFTSKLANNAKNALIVWDEPQEEEFSKVTKSELILVRYIEFCTLIQKKVAKRSALVKDLDYYRGKVDNLRKKMEKSSKNKEQESMERAEYKVEELAGSFEAVSYELMDEMTRCVNLKSSVYACCLADYLEVQRTQAGMLSSQLEQCTAKDCSAILTNPVYWPSDADFQMGVSNGSRPVSGRPQSMGKVTYARAKYDYTAIHDDELTITVGDEIRVMERTDANWMKGRCRGKEGIFPATYVDVL